MSASGTGNITQIGKRREGWISIKCHPYLDSNVHKLVVVMKYDLIKDDMGLPFISLSIYFVTVVVDLFSINQCIFLSLI